ncbi:MAG: hypothetical protein E7294_01360 [Lachnospiraceae bacterium]|nr:hypothetical protein [Lachnospiraceae bacterium]
MKIVIDNNSQIKIDADFFEGVNVIFGYSGTGKTFLFDRINDYYANSKELNVTLINYQFCDKKEDLIVEFCEKSDLILLDNADLYLTESLIDKLRAECKCIVISMKNTVFFSHNEITVLSVEYDNHLIRTKRR